MAGNLIPWTPSWGDMYSMMMERHHIGSLALVLGLLSTSFVPLSAQRLEPAGIQRAVRHDVLSPPRPWRNTTGSRTVSPWPMVIGAAVGAGAGWAAGRFYQGQCETPACDSRSTSYDADGLLIGAGVGLVTGILVALMRSDPEDR